MKAGIRPAFFCLLSSPPYKGGVAAASADGAVLSHKEYLLTGQAPPLAADQAYPEFVGQLSGSAKLPAEGIISETSDDTDNSALSTVHSPLSVRFDAYGREIFVESEAANGKPIVWYDYDSGA